MLWCRDDGRPRLLGISDYFVPLNGGLWTLGRPSRALYERGLAELERTTWNATHGFGLVGTPTELCARDPGLRKHMAKTRMLKHNTWDQPYGDCDQGFLFYMFFVVNGGVYGELLPEPPKACARSPNGEGCAHTARHYWGHSKPWMLDGTNHARVAYYLAHTDFRARVNQSHCAARFAGYAAKLPPNTRVSAPKWGGKLQRVM